MNISYTPVGSDAAATTYSEAANFASLPAASSVSGQTYLVREAQGVYFVNRKPAGLYRSDGASWTYLADQSEAYFADTLAWANITSKPSTFPPSNHNTSHQSGGADAIKLDDLATPDDNTDLDATTGRHGLLPKLGGGTTNFLRADGTWSAPPGGGAGSGDVVGPASSTDNAVVRFDGTTGKLVQNSSATIDDNGTASVNTVKLSASPTVGSPVIGELYINTAENGLPEVRINSNSSLTIGAEMYAQVVNKTGATLLDGKVVYISGAQGNRSTADLARADSLTTSRMLGVVTADIANNAEGFVTILGEVHGFNTSGFSAGDTLYLSASTAGELTNVAPSSPNYVVIVGRAQNSTANGLISVNPHEAIALNTSLGTNIVAPSQGAVKSYVDTAISGLTPSSVGLGNVTNNAQTQAAIVPNTAPSAGQILVGNAGGTAYAPQTVSSEATLASTGAVTLTNSAVIGKVLTGYTSGAGTVAATDTILQGIQKLNGNTVAHTGASSGVHGVTGSVVGTTDTQNISNKTITGSTYNAITLTAQATGFTAAGGTSSRTLTVSGSSTVNQDVTTTSAPTFNSTTIAGTAGAGFITLAAQSSNPSAPAAGNALIHAATNNGFTRLELDNEAGTNVVITRDSVTIAQNTSGSTITKGQLVRITGSTGNVPTVALARADSSTTIPAVYIALDNVGNNNFGQFMRSGIITSFDTSAFSAGNPVFLSTTTAGGLTNTRPSGTTNFVQRIGTVLSAGVNGSIDIQIALAVLNMETGTNAATWTGTTVAATTFTGSLGSASAPSYALTGDTNTGIYSPGADQLAITTGGTARVYFDAAGDIGIGQSSPTAYLHIKAGTATANTAPIKLTAGTVNTTSEAGAIEFDGTDFFINI